MKIGLMLTAAALAAAVTTTACSSTDSKPKAKVQAKTPAPAPAAAKTATPEPPMDPQAMMEAWTKAGALGEPHQAFAKQAGTWDLTVRMFMDPNIPPMESKSTATRELMLGGRFMVEHVKGDMGPMGPFEGHGILGYNNLTRQYDHIWMDSMSTGMMVSHGQAGADGAITMTGEYDDAMTGGKTKARTVSKMVSDNEQKFEMYESRGGAPETKVMEIIYKRTGS